MVRFEDCPVIIDENLKRCNVMCLELGSAMLCLQRFHVCKENWHALPASRAASPMDHVVA